MRYSWYNLHRNRLLRRVTLPLLSRFNPGDVNIRHHYTGDPLRLHSFHHRGYWFHGRRREARTIALFQSLIEPRDVVFDVGGHIGYMSLLFAHLVGDGGRVVVFEPGENNLPYLRENLHGKPNVTIIERAAGAAVEQREFFLDDLSGANNTLVENFEVAARNRRAAFFTQEEHRVRIAVTTLDNVIEETGLVPQFIKIDVEGFEDEVVQGMERLIDTVQPMLMIEVQRHHEAIFGRLEASGYRAFDDLLQEYGPYRLTPKNAFFLHRTAHEHQLQTLGLA